MNKFIKSYFKFIKRFTKSNEEFLVKLAIIFCLTFLMWATTWEDMEAQEVVGQVGEYTIEKACYNNPKCPQINEEDNIVYQSIDLFHEDNLNYRGNPNTISFQGEYIDYHTLDTGIIFITDDLRQYYQSGDKIYYNGKFYIVIDNKSNCPMDYCYEILS